MNDSRDLSQDSATTLGTRVAAARRRGLVGRDAELGVLGALLEAGGESAHIVWLHGVGGIGKTTLLDAFAEMAAADGRACLRFDARELRDSLAPLLAALAGPAPRRVLLFDTCEALGALEQDLFERHLPQLPEDTRLVFAGRHPPSGRWREDPGWRALLRVLEIGALDRRTAADLLERGGMPAAACAHWLDFARGHPLALVLALASHRQHAAFVTPATPDPNYIGRLLERFVDSLPTPEHRTALELCALARVTSEGLLREPLGDAAPALFAWLKSLSFVRSAPRGLIPHDLVRELVTSELRWRDPDAFQQRRRQISRYLVGRMHGLRDVQMFGDYLYARRYAPFNDGFLVPETESPLYVDTLRASDEAGIAALVAQAEGESARAHVAFWMQRQPQAFAVFRGHEGVAGFMAEIELRGADWTLPAVDADPVLLPLRRYVGAQAGPHGRDSSVLRWWIQRGALHRPGSVQNLVQARCMLNWATREALRWSFIPNSNAEFWHRHFTGIHFRLLEECACTIGSLRLVPYARDWQRHPYWAWIAGAFDGASDPTPDPPAPAVLDAAGFAEALRRALRDFGSDARLAQSPLRALLAGGDLAALRERLRAEIAALDGEPRGAALRRVLEVSFLSGCPSQEAASERLDLPFGTYRHRLRAAEVLLIERLRLGLHGG